MVARVNGQRTTGDIAERDCQFLARRLPSCPSLPPSTLRRAQLEPGEVPPTASSSSPDDMAERGKGCAEDPKASTAAAAGDLDLGADEAKLRARVCRSAGGHTLSTTPGLNETPTDISLRSLTFMVHSAPHTRAHPLCFVPTRHTDNGTASIDTHALCLLASPTCLILSSFSTGPSMRICTT